MGSIMIDALIRMLGGLIHVLEQWKGHSTVKEVKHPSNAMGKLVGFALNGYQLEIFCQRRHYRRAYDKWFIPNQDKIAFHVYSMVTSDAPDILQRACEFKLDIPALLPSWVGDEAQREAAVNAYLDILAEKIGPLHDDAKKHIVVRYKD